jgi:hypothetical protein
VSQKNSGRTTTTTFAAFIANGYMTEREADLVWTQLRQARSWPEETPSEEFQKIDLILFQIRRDQE